MEQIVNDIADGYRQYILDPGKLPQLLLLVAFLCTFGFIRTSAHMIRKEVSWWPGNVQTKSGLHIHHLVWGIVLMMLVGNLAIGIEPPSPGREILAVLFGVGMGLTLDEFALWLRLKDVYWSEEGRESIDAVIVAAAFLAMTLIGLPFWIDLSQALVKGLTGVGDVSGEKVGQNLIVASSQLAGFGFAIIAFLKRKRFMGVIGLFVPLVAIAGGFRLAKPNSRWARRRYHEDKLLRSLARYPDKGQGEPQEPGEVQATA